MCAGLARRCCAGPSDRSGPAVDQDDPGRHPVGVCDGFRREATGGNEDAAVCLGSVQRSDEFLDLRPPDRLAGAVSLGLDVDAIQPERVLADHAVQSFVSGLPEVFCRPGGTAVPHRRQHRKGPGAPGRQALAGEPDPAPQRPPQRSPPNRPRHSKVAGQGNACRLLERVLTTLRLTKLRTSVKASGTKEP
jgi:hypothetical protein